VKIGYNGEKRGKKGSCGKKKSEADKGLMRGGRVREDNQMAPPILIEKGNSKLETDPDLLAVKKGGGK